MNTKLSRRNFLNTSMRGGLALAGAATLSPLVTPAVEPVKRVGKPRMLLSLAAYSFRETFKSPDSAKPFTLENFVDFCADQGCAGAEVTSYYFPEAPSQEFLVNLKRHAFLRGVAISGSAVGNNFAQPDEAKRAESIAHVKKWVDYCVVLGAPHIRVFAGPTPEKDISTAKKRCITALEECGEYAGKHGVFLGLENHGGIVTQPDDLLEIVKAIKSQWVGINLDTGNFNTDDPYVDLARCAPYAVNVQVKVEMHPKSRKNTEPADYRRLAKILRDVNYQGFVALEYEAKLDPWKGVPENLKKLGEALASV